MSNSQLNKLKSWIKNGTEVSLNPPSNMIRNSIDQIDFPPKLLLTDTQVSRLRKALAKVSLDKVINRADVLRKIMPRPKKFFGIGITLIKIEIKDIIKIIKSLESRRILLKETTKKVTSQEGGFVSFLRPWMTTGLPLV